MPAWRLRLPFVLRLVPLLVSLLVPIAGCANSSGPFSVANARRHVDVLAQEIGARPIGTASNAAARAYVVDRLRDAGFDVRVQEVQAERPERGLTARTFNVIASRTGIRSEAIALVAHYDSAPGAPGAADDGLGVAVCLEVARIFGTRRMEHALMIVLTDGEEAGLLGAVGLLKDPAARSIAAYLNLEAIGLTGPSVLFQTGPANAWIVAPWTHSPSPRGSSYASEVYRRLPNDTDFSILQSLGAPGLNFAPTGDSYTYHTALDTSARLSDDTIGQTGANTVAILERLDRTDVTVRTADGARYFDLLGQAAVTYTTLTARLIAIVGLILAGFVTVRGLTTVVRDDGVLRLVTTILWRVVTLALAAGAMVGAATAIRSLRGMDHPWYASPFRFFVFLSGMGLGVAWLLAATGDRFPQRVRPVRKPVVVWCVTLPVWAGLAAFAERAVPAASYLWTVPLLAAGVALAAVPPRASRMIRIASLLPLLVAAVLWLPEAHALLSFLVPMFGRMPAPTPIRVYPAFLVVVALMVVPPASAVFGNVRLRRMGFVIALGILCFTIAVAGAATLLAPAYTAERPLRVRMRFIHDGGRGQAYLEAASNEHVAPLSTASGTHWQRVKDAPPVSPPFQRLPEAFVFRATVPGNFVPPGSTSATVLHRGKEIDLSVAARTLEPGIAVSVVLPPGLVPLRSSLPGIRRQPPPLGETEQWTATYLSPPDEGFRFQATFKEDDVAAVRQAFIVFESRTLPRADSWHLPDWQTIWRPAALYIVPLATVVGQPVPEADAIGR